ncbi:MAG TPA: CHAP domain-containing protein [Candidatus Sulfotelmatobacter sp.]|nr:CHAP domain-containing protein [Candidatus Sulfotelmatobacter sp.]
MRTPPKPTILAMFCCLALCVSSAQQASPEPAASRQDASGSRARKPDKTLTADDGLSVIAAALDSKVPRDSAHDCSHLVHAIYQRAGFPYAYASSTDLYDGVEGFLQVTHPQPGDVIVWPGHAGIVVRPSRHVFFSFLTAGPGTDDYHSQYWVGRGQPRFYRYIKNHRCAGCTSVSALPHAQ